MCRKNPGWREAERRLTTTRKMQLIYKWKNISDNIDVGNVIKIYYRSHLTWAPRDNLIKAKSNSFTDELLKNLIQNIVSPIK